MTPRDALIELPARVGAGNGAVLVSDEELSQWPSAAVAAMKSQRLVAKARPGSSAICPGCERACVMPVHTLPRASGAAASFIVCDKRSNINRVPISTERLRHWRCDVDSVRRFVAASLGLRRSDQHPGASGLLNIGIASGGKRSQCLACKSMTSPWCALDPLVQGLGLRHGVFSVSGVTIAEGFRRLG